jgi:hypothetical protein
MSSLTLALFPIPYQDVSFMTIFWVILILSAVVSNIASIFMKLEVNDKLPPEEQFSWWNRDGREVARRYKELHPDGYLPPVARWSFWLFLAMFVAWAIVSTTGKLD